ncbi:MAG: endonuclease/exonuclease/phosphatase [Saprospiraceae bacterium]|nr:endonuclease/exonuclease/phosphatase [Saprospiraceae bacterium]
MNTYNISFWNLENLFDVEHSPRRSEKLERAIGSDLEGWTQVQLDLKIGQLSSIIQQLNNGLGPDILGVCEIENAHVLGLLVDALSPLNRNYKIVHADTADQRGIDVAILYDSSQFSIEPDMVFNHFVMRRTATRDILQVNFLSTANNQRLVVIVNHWPSRSGGQYESEGYRQIAGETLAYFHQRILDVHGRETPVIAMGDFNDEPFNKSIVDHALALRSKNKVANGRNPYFLNMMWSLMEQGSGSFFFENLPNMLDQFLINSNLLHATSPIRVKADSARINNFPVMVKPGDYPSPIAFGGMGKPINDSGFSDHFPISIDLETS